ncbi:GAF domain-containing protein [Dermatobacter hominis]|uniref:GAF domain-containing protein n=1 Tax=Dermatobacter hominis TaxID=2884263 RepID=UPI001D12D78A|nr:GAF domain-containing protein [Dermatobacter hominis]UDY34641.1 GAF domain-containing protein [Dermatobacter hominis]
MTAPPSLDDLRTAFDGAVPAVVVTADAAGVPNVTYLSRVRRVGDERIALSNQFLSKTARNLAENPRASVLVLDPTNYDQYRLQLVYERTERRGPVFERMKADIDLIAALHGMSDVFRLRAADIYRVVDIERVPDPPYRLAPPQPWGGRDHRPADPLRTTAELAARMGRSTDLDRTIGLLLDGLDELFGLEHSILALVSEDGRSLFTIASHGYSEQGVGSEVAFGEGFIGEAAQRCEPVRFGNLRQIAKYSRSVRRTFEGQGGSPGPMIDVPGLEGAESRLAVPAMSQGQLVGVVMVESRRPVAFDEADELALSVLAGLLAAAVDADRESGDRDGVDPGPVEGGGAPVVTGSRVARIRSYTTDGSTFIDGEYLIKGVAGRVLWSLLRQHRDEGRTEFTNREVRLDPSLELPAFRDNLDSRLLLLKRRLDEQSAPVRIERTGRGRFRLEVHCPLELELGADA